MSLFSVVLNGYLPPKKKPGILGFHSNFFDRLIFFLFAKVKEIKLGGERHMEEIAKELGTLYGNKEQGNVSSYIIDFMGAYALDGSVFIALEAMDGSLMDLIGPNRVRGLPV